MKTLLYRIDALPDPAAPVHRKPADGNLHKAIGRGLEHYMRVVAEMPDSSVTASIRFDYSPPHGHPQLRLPGSGATAWNLKLLLHLHKEGIPFIVIEPIKEEYGAIAMLAKHPHEANSPATHHDRRRNA